MTVDTTPELLIAKHVRKISHRADITRGEESVLLAASESIERLAAVLKSAEAGISLLELSRTQENERSLPGLELDREFVQRVADFHGIRADEVTGAFLERQAITARSARGLAEARPPGRNELMAELREKARSAIQAVWADDPDAADAATLASNIVRFQEPVLADMANHLDRAWKTPVELAATTEAAMAPFDPRPGHGIGQDGVK